MTARVLAGCAVLALGLPAPGAAQTSTVDFTISGSSTVRNWTCTAQGTIAITPATAGTPVPGFDKGVQSATVTVPLKAFQCPDAEMTQHLNEAMKSDKFPEVVYRLEKYEVAAGQPQAAGTLTVTGRGMAFQLVEGLRTNLDADLTLGTANGEGSIGGRVTILEGDYRRRISLTDFSIKALG